MQLTENTLKKILIVEDEEINQILLTQILSSYEVLHAYNGAEAMEMIEENAGDLSMVILDLVMPGMDGIQVLKKMKAAPATKDIPVVVMSAQGDKEGDALELGAINFLNKPYGDPRVIRAKVENLIRFNETVKIVNADTHDEITGLLNMRAFLNEAEIQKAEHIKAGESKDYAVVFFDLANFKGFNMRYGIREGDHCLKRVGEILTELFPGNLISRFADDHFVLITRREGLVEKIDEAWKRVKPLGKNVHIHLKAGIKYAEENIGSIPIVVACDQAKTACDRLEKTAEKSIAVYDEAFSAQLARRDYIIEHLDEAIEKGYLKVYVQPVVRALTGNLCGAEALVRWVDPELGFLSPGEFISVLEEAQLIYKVDSFVIREICRGYRRRKENNEPVIPLSFNLSRLDFALTDIAQVIFDAAEEYRVPSSMLNVEITESLFVKEDEKIRTEIARIKEAGFKVWMDDFGSGYSSLNLLKDYDFDELKIDMQFLSSFTEKSKNILKSIIRMAKEIGIQTLAEGVETKEQFEFLRSIGCEKIQGYYFGKPEPIVGFMAHCLEKGMRIETRAWSDFYDKAGEVNFLDERPIALFEDDREKIKFLFANQAFMASLRSNGTETLEQASENINTPGSPMQHMYRKFSDELIASGEEREITYPSGAQYMSLRGRIIAGCNGHYMHLSSLTNVTRNANEEKQNTNDSLVRNVMYMYDEIMEIDVEEDCMKRFDIAQDGMRSDDNGIVRNLSTSMSQHVREEIYLEDRRRFLEFADLDTMEERVRSSESGVISSYFRCKEKDGNFHWRVHTVMAIPKTDYKRFRVIGRRAPLDDPEMKRQIFTQENAAQILEKSMTENAAGEITNHLLWKNMQNYSKQKFFWKDMNRRFVGVSQAFMDYYGLKSEDEIIGKTDEEMRWHVSDGPYKDDELEALSAGRHVHDAPGKCIIKGVVHNIYANKMPLYRDGKIVGLIGYFVDADRIKPVETESSNISTVDLVTRLSNARGLMESYLNYRDEFVMNHKDYVVIGINVEGYTGFKDAFGKEAGDQLLCRIAEILLAHFKTEATISRLHSSKFMILYQVAEQVQLQEVLQLIKEEIRAITEVHGHACTCYPEVKTSFATEPAVIEEMIKVFWN